MSTGTLSIGLILIHSFCIMRSWVKNVFLKRGDGKHTYPDNMNCTWANQIHHMTVMTQALPFQTQSCFVSKISQLHLCIEYFRAHLPRNTYVTQYTVSNVTDVTFEHFSVTRAVHVKNDACSWLYPIIKRY